MKPMADSQMCPVNVFRFLGISFDAKTGAASFSYGFDNTYQFEEKIEFGTPSRILTPKDEESLHQALRVLHFMAGISYFKAFMPPVLHVETEQPDTALADFLNEFYKHGLGEFSVRNAIDISSITFFHGGGKTPNPKDLTLPSKAAVLVGGGKDSCVSLEAVKKADLDCIAFAVNPARPIQGCMDISGLPYISVKRILDPRLFDLNAKGAMNGHVPITGIISMIAVIAGILHGFDTIILSNERSANEATVGDANHQYSKSSSFEKLFQTMLHNNISNSIRYFSLLRPLSELGIARLFSKSKKYDDVFTSCNQAFSLSNPLKGSRWCGHCPKCAFVFLMLACAMDKSRLMSIFQSNLLDTAGLIDQYKNLCGLSGQKPWECVGEIMESAATLHHLAHREDWKNDIVVSSLYNDLVSRYGSEELKRAYTQSLAWDTSYVLPSPYMNALESYAE